LLHPETHTVHAPTLGEAIEKLDVKRQVAPAIEEFYRAAPGGVRTTEAFSQSKRYAELDLDRATGVIRDLDHAFSRDGGLAVLFGNIAVDGCIVKTAGVDSAHLTFTGPARIFESQDSAVEAILGDKILPGDVVLIRYEGPRGGPGMQEMLYPTSYLKSKGLGKACALITDGRFSGGSRGACIGHISPEAASRGPIAALKDGDIIEIDIPNCKINVKLTEKEIAARMAKVAKFEPRVKTGYLSRYTEKVGSASKGAIFEK
jgi:dihydroxy-acid dehydratase